MKTNVRHFSATNESINAYTGKETSDDQVASDWSSQPIPLPVYSRGHSTAGALKQRSWSYKDYLAEFDDQLGGEFSSTDIPLPKQR